MLHLIVLSCELVSQMVEVRFIQEVLVFNEVFDLIVIVFVE